MINEETHSSFYGILYIIQKGGIYNEDYYTQFKENNMLRYKRKKIMIFLSIFKLLILRYPLYLIKKLFYV